MSRWGSLEVRCFFRFILPRWLHFYIEKTFNQRRRDLLIWIGNSEKTWVIRETGNSPGQTNLTRKWASESAGRKQKCVLWLKTTATGRMLGLERTTVWVSEVMCGIQRFNIQSEYIFIFFNSWCIELGISIELVCEYWIPAPLDVVFWKLLDFISISRRNSMQHIFTKTLVHILYRWTSIAYSGKH